MRPGKEAWGSSRSRVVLAGVLLSLLLVGGNGCTRVFFRNRADKEVAQVIAEKDKFAFWKLQNFFVYPHPRARFADPTNPDRPPMPPDDPAARLLSPNPQRPGKAGVANVEGTGYLELLHYWDENNRARLQAENIKPALTFYGAIDLPREPAAPEKGEPGPQPRPVDPSPNSEEKPLLITLEQAMELGLINSRDFQTAREEIYLAALPVTLQRFSFAAQGFAGGLAARNWAAGLTPGGPLNQWDLNSTAGFSKLFSTGALLLFQFANQTVVNLAGSNVPRLTSQSTLNLDLVQPLLQGGGRAVTLEPLTQAERNLLYQVRSFARFRKQFYANIATGGELNLFTVQPIRQGYLPTLLRGARLMVAQKNLEQLKDIYKLVEAFKEGGQVTPLQVFQVSNQILSVTGDTLNLSQDVQDALDQFKIQLGIPVNVKLELDEKPLRPILDHLARAETIQNQYEDTLKEAQKFDALGDAPKLRARLKELAARADLTQGTRFRAQFPARWKAWEILPEKELPLKLKKYREERRKILEDKADAEAANKPAPPGLEVRLEELERELDLGDLEQLLRKYEQQPWLKDANEGRRRAIQSAMFRDVHTGFSLVLTQARKERVDFWRTQWPELDRVCLGDADLLTGDADVGYDLVVQAALANRLDLMNQRAQLVDAWRQIKVSANALLAALNVEYHLSSTSPQTQPLVFDGSRLQNQLVFNGQVPLVRKAERNFYRAQLIAYQRARRDLMALQDAIATRVRQEFRQLRVLAANYKIQQKIVELAYIQLESSKEAFQQPPGGGEQAGPPGSGSAANAAALTNQLLGSQRNLAGSFNDLFAFWINFQITRLQLYRDLELMPLDNQGVWHDEHAPPGYHFPGAHLSGEPGIVHEPGHASPGPVSARLLPPAGAPVEPAK